MIGLSSSIFPRNKWVDGISRTGIKCVEIDFETSKFPTLLKEVKQSFKPWSKYFKTSAYSGAGGIFSDEKHMRKSQEQKVHWEIKVCKTIKARELIIKLECEEFHKKTTTKFLKALNRKAVFNGVQLLIENNAQSRFSNIIDMDYVLQQAKQAQVCLNTYNLQRSGHDWDEFVKPLNTRIKYVRANKYTKTSLILLIMQECSPLKWIVTDTDLEDAMQTLKKLTSQGVEL